jgi:LPS sulfotransferase NodH
MPSLLPYLRTLLIIRKKQLFNFFSLKKGHQYTPFIILCEPRTGSTLLHTYLNSHPRIWSYGEVLRERQGKHKSLRLEELVFKSHASFIKAVGLKLFYFYAVDPAYASIFREIIKRKDIKIIHLTREDRLSQFVSLKLAESSSTWSSTRKKEGQKKIIVNVKGYLAFAKNSKKQEQSFDRLFHQHELLKLSYEELNQNPQTTLQKVQLFLGVPPRKLFTLLKKQNTEDLERVVENYEEVMAKVNNL